MAVLMISYDLVKEGRNYSDLYAAIRAYRNFVNPVESVWLIETNETPDVVRNKLFQQMDANDKLIVLTIAKPSWAVRNVIKEAIEWLDARLSR